jgi:hypothetical protein
LDLTENLVSCCVDPTWQPPPLPFAMPTGLTATGLTATATAAASAAEKGDRESAEKGLLDRRAAATTITRRFDRTAVRDLPHACARLAYGIALEPRHGTALRAASKSVLQWTAGFPLPADAEAVEMRRWARAARPAVRAIQRLYAQWPELQAPGW